MTEAAGRPSVVVVGLGPGADEHVTVQTLAAIDRVAHRFLRTSRHPSAHLVRDATSFDDLYDSADRFADVYATIVEELVAAATTHGEILYAVPGSPLVLERTVRLLLDDDRVRTEVLPAMSFLDLVWARLGIDPVEAGVQLVDGHDFATAAAGATGPLLIAHAHADWVLSDIKLAAEHATGDEAVVILQRLGTPEELVTTTTWSELDRTVAADHLTCVYVPRLGEPIAAGYVRLHELARTLARALPVGHRADPRQPRAAPRRGDVRARRRPGRPRSGRPDDRRGADRRAGRRAVPGRVPRRHRRAGRAVLDGRRDDDAARQARPPPPARLRRRRGRRRRRRQGQLGRHQAAREGAHVGVRRRPDVAAGAGLRPARRPQGGQGRLRLAVGRRSAGQGRRGAGRAAGGHRQRRRGSHRRRARRRRHSDRQRRPSRRGRCRAGGAGVGGQVPPPLRSGRAARRRTRDRPPRRRPRDARRAVGRGQAARAQEPAAESSEAD